MDRRWELFPSINSNINTIEVVEVSLRQIPIPIPARGRSMEKQLHPISAVLP